MKNRLRKKEEKLSPPIEKFSPPTSAGSTTYLVRAFRCAWHFHGVSSAGTCAGRRPVLIRRFRSALDFQGCAPPRCVTQSARSLHCSAPINLLHHEAQPVG